MNKHLTTKEFYEIAKKNMLFIVDEYIGGCKFPFNTGDIVEYIGHDNECEEKPCDRRISGECKGHGIFQLNGKVYTICMSWTYHDKDIRRSLGYTYLIPYHNEFLSDEDFEI